MCGIVQPSRRAILPVTHRKTPIDETAWQEIIVRGRLGPVLSKGDNGCAAAIRVTSPQQPGLATMASESRIAA